MTISSTPRFSLTRWSSGSDPLGRSQLDGDHVSIDELAAIDIQVATRSERPAASVRGRYCFVISDRTLWRDSGVAWFRVSESDASGEPVLRRFLNNEKAASDSPSSYPLGVSTFDTTGQGSWPAPNLMVATQRTIGRAVQTVTQSDTGRTWVRSQVGAATDAWARFIEVVESLRFTSSTRPTTGLFDGIRGYETDTTGTVVWLAGANRWLYESFLTPPYWSFRGADHGMLAGDWPVSNRATEHRMVIPSSDANFPGAYVHIQIPGTYTIAASLRIAPGASGGNERSLIIQQERNGLGINRRASNQYTIGVTGHNVSGDFRCQAGDRIIVLFYSQSGGLRADNGTQENQFTGRWASNL